MNVGLSPGPGNAGAPMMSPHHGSMGSHPHPQGYPVRSPHPHMSPHQGSPGHGVMAPSMHSPHHGHMGMPFSPMHPHGSAPMGSMHPSQGPMSSPHPQQGLPLSSAQQQPPTAQAQSQNQEATQVSTLPLPPMSYVEKYTDQAMASNSTPPPPAPINDSYSMFGNPFSNEDNIIQSLESQGIRRLYSTKDLDRKKELHKLNHSILVNFLDLLDILIRAPEKREEKLEDINLLFIHMHHLINEFRPHQARETLRVMLQMQMRKRLQIAEKFQKNLDQVQETIENAIQALPQIDEIEESRRLEVNKSSQISQTLPKETALNPTGCTIADRILCEQIDKFIDEMEDQY